MTDIQVVVNGEHHSIYNLQHNILLQILEQVGKALKLRFDASQDIINSLYRRIEEGENNE